MNIQRYPISMHKLDGGRVVSKVANSAEEESEATEQGFRPKLPDMPKSEADEMIERPLFSEVDPVVLSRIAALESVRDSVAALVLDLTARVEKLEQQKRGPGRPPKESN